MSTIAMAPGVYQTETDISQYIKLLSSTMLGIVTAAPKGELNTVTLVTSPNQLTTTFGIPSVLYPGLLVAREFLAAGGTQCLIVRVSDDTDAAATVAVNMINSSTFALTASSTGTDGNNLKASFSYTNQATTTVSATKTLTASTLTSETLPTVPVVPGSVSVTWNNVVVASDDSNGNLVFTSGALTGSVGTVNYNTGLVDITPPSGFTTATHTLSISALAWTAFTLQLQYIVTLADTTTRQYVVEQYLGLNLSNIVAALANSQYLAPLGSAPAAFPVAGTYTLSGGTDGIESIEDSDYVGTTIGGATGLQLFAYPDQVNVNLVTVPGVSSAAVRQALIQLAGTTRQDCMCLLDPPVDATVQSVADWANANGSFSSYGVIDSTYAAIYFPWFISFNSVTNANENTPPSAGAVQAFVRSGFGDAPAGPNRGILQNCSAVLTPCTLGDREFLGQNRINPIGNLNGLGIMILGQYTATLEATSLDRVGARMTLLQIEKAVTTALYYLLFQRDNTMTWQQAVNLVQPYLNGLVNSGIIYFGQIFCDQTTNDLTDENNNTMVAIVELQLPKYAERIIVNFALTALGSTITEQILSNNVS